MFARRCFRVRNRLQPAAHVRKCSDPAPMALPLGRALTSDFSWLCHVSVCAAIPCDFHESGMPCKKGDAIRCAGAGFRESDAFASQLHWDLQFQSGVLEVFHRAVTLGFAAARLLRKLRFSDKSQVERRFRRKCV